MLLGFLIVCRSNSFTFIISHRNTLIIMAKIYCLLGNNELMKFLATTAWSQPSNKSNFADFWRDLWISPETCLEIAPPLTTHVNPPGNLHAGGEGDIYRIIISEYSVSWVIMSSLLGINITNDNVVTTCGWDWGIRSLTRPWEGWQQLVDTSAQLQSPQSNWDKYFQLNLIRSKNRDDALRRVTTQAWHRVRVVHSEFDSGWIWWTMDIHEQ